MGSKKRIYLSPPHMSGKEQKYVEEAFRSNWIAPLGPHVDGFEEELASFLKVKCALALSSGTAAMHLALLALNIKQGDLVFCSALTFTATANPILYVGAEPVFIDSEPQSWNMSSLALERALAEAITDKLKPKAVIVVNLFGQSADMEPLKKLCKNYGVPLVEDAAESLGATYRGRPSGSFGKFGILSFNGNKIITTAGGGALVSDDLESLERARYLASQARQPVKHYEHNEVGYNYRLSNILAAIGRAQLEVLEERVQARRTVFERYQQAFKDMDGISFMPEAGYGRANRWLSVMTINPELCGTSKDDLIETLEKENIEARPVWKPMQLQPLFADKKYYAHREGISISARLFEQGLCLPSGSNLAEVEQNRIIEIIQSVLVK